MSFTVTREVIAPPFPPVQKPVWTQGKVLGGSSVLNFMIYNRGNRKDYDTWAAGGATGWSYDEVLPYFKKSEDNTNASYVDNGRNQRKQYGRIVKLLALVFCGPRVCLPLRDVNFL